MVSITCYLLRDHIFQQISHEFFISFVLFANSLTVIINLDLPIEIAYYKHNVAIFCTVMYLFNVAIETFRAAFILYAPKVLVFDCLIGVMSHFKLHMKRFQSILFSICVFARFQFLFSHLNYIFRFECYLNCIVLTSPNIAQ